MDDNPAGVKPATTHSPFRDASWMLPCGLLALTVAAAWLRFLQCGESLWIDELHTAWTIDAGLSEIPRRAAQGNYSPFYFLLPWLSTQLFGMHEWSLRLPSLLAGIALVPACGFVAQRWFRSRALAVLAAVLVTFDPHLLFYSLDARPYAIVQLGAVLHAWLLARCLRPYRRRGDQIAFCLLGIALAYLHYTTALLLVAEFVCTLIWLALGRDRRAFAESSVCFAVMAIGCVPAGFAAWPIAARRELWNQFVPQQNNFGTIFPFGTYSYAAAGSLALIRVAGWWRRQRPIFASGPSGPMALSRNGCGRSPGRATRVAKGGKLHDDSAQPGTAAVMVLLCCWLLVPLMITWQTTRSDFARLFLRRYLMFSYPAMILLTSALGLFSPSRRGRLTFAVLVVAATSYVLGPWQQLRQDGRVVRHSHEDWRGAIAAVNEGADESQPVFVRAGLIEESLLAKSQSAAAEDVETLREYLLLPVSSLYKLNAPREDIYPLTADPQIRFPAAALDKVKTSGGCWLVVRGGNWFDKHGEDIVRSLADTLRVDEIRIRCFGNVRVIHCRMASEHGGQRR